ncbi:BglG family transcription antiterminator [Alteribacillus bidgolensis]|uniref:Transcriptional antiterminator, BglG family n=1 Tax=Alteribacillus bidgolensis TaxID=930129 RepID=A0A1G8RXZ7_9BACI|nr:BglG family transcription antiterminator [Alteribacillus bidgolensis]SDJ21838.1 transcriptional antiterminator, BglG family [Alteribacillus bidgolensis]
MKQQYPVLYSRQKELLRTLLIANTPVSHKELSELFKLSKRTIQREMKVLKNILDVYELKIEKKLGDGFELKGSEEGKKTLKEHIEQAKTLSVYSPEERRDGITYDLLLSKEPIKQFVFSNKYGVAETTVSSDLDKVAIWLETGGIHLIRTPGIGVYIDGQEKHRRTMLSQLLHKDITFEEWLELFHNKTETEEGEVQGRLGMVIRSRLLNFIQTDKILAVERVVNQVLKEQTTIELTDRNYVNLIVHLILAVQRIKSGEVIETPNLSKDYEFDRLIFSIAERIVDRLETVLSISIPAIEVNYIALHLSGARLLNEKKMDNYEIEEFAWVELAQSFIRAVEFHLTESFEGDELLLEGLVSHFAPAFNRLKYGLQIHNPMLEEIKERYQEVFAACKQACELLSKKAGYPIPNDEVGYLAMHIGAALIRKNDTLKNEYKAIVVCSSGLGTSTYLASSLHTKMPNLKVEAVVSMNQLEGYLREKMEVDILISTINLPFVKNKNVVIVSPFLKQEDLSRIQNSLSKINKPQSFQKRVNVDGKSSSVMSLAKYGEGMIQILNNLKIYHDIDVRPPVMISSILSPVKDVKEISDFWKLSKDLEKREQQGGFVLGNLAMIHATSEGVNNLLVGIFRIKEPIVWPFDDEEQPIHTVLLLVAPKESPKEHIEMLSEISSMLIEESFVNVLLESPADVVRSSLEVVLSKAYEMKATRFLKGNRAQ